MSLEQVKGFYQKLDTDEVFRSQIQAVKSKEECSQIVKAAGYNFTQQEFEEYTAQMLEADPSESELEDLSEKELETVFGGLSSFEPELLVALETIFPPTDKLPQWPQLMYGSPPPPSILPSL